MIREKIIVSKEKVRGKTKRKEVIYQQAQHTSFFDSGASVIRKEEKIYQKGEICR
jgi:hypothetical protein